VGLLWKRFTATERAGTFTDMLLGTTGAFAARWLVDVLGHFGVNDQHFSVVLAICGSSLLLWCFHGFTRKERQIRRPEATAVPSPDPRTTESDPDSRSTTARAAQRPGDGPSAAWQ